MPDRMTVAIVGGGPAGATCARQLSLAGFRVTLFEARPADEKPCGGGIPAEAMRDFPELSDPALSRRVVREVEVYGPSDRRVRVVVPGGIHIFRRVELDSFLRERAAASGAAVVHARVSSARRRAHAWELSTDKGDAGPFDALVAADGVRGGIRRSLAGRWREGRLTLALYGYVAGAARPQMV
ncbi:MAG TPA: FAD-dependent oxidoreductase, partial [Candidatus Polarisedimenticolia bacterium]|nr:FAD-dependent oxidoreductase [Candidatus Polarisedimenticolia bacterium]